MEVSNGESPAFQREGWAWVPHTMKKSILAILLLAITSQAFAIIYRKPVTAHQQLSSTGTLTHAALESTLTAVNEATTTLKSISDAHAATLAQVGVDTATLAGLIGSGAGDNLGNHVATTTLNMGGNAIDGVTIINTPFDNDLGWFKPLIIGGDTSQGFATGVRVINYNSPSYMGNSELTMQWLGNPFLYFNDGGWNSYSKGIFYYDPNYTGIPALQISSNNVIMFGNCTAPYFYGDVSNCTGFPAATVPANISVDTITVGGTPALEGYPVSVNGDVLVSSGVLYLRNGQLLLAHPDGETSVYLLSTDSDSYNADILMQSGSTLTVTGSGGNKSHYVQNGNITCDYIHGDGSRLTGLADGVAIAESTTTLKSLYDAEVTSRTTGVWDNQNAKVGSATVSDSCSGNALTATTASTAIYALNLPTTTFSNVTVGSATNAGDANTLDGQHGTYYAIKADVGESTGTLRADLLAVKQSTAVTITSNWITLGATQTYVTTLSTRPASGIQTQPFTISSATARVNGGTSATLRLFITDKNTEFNISAATPIWNTGVVAGTEHTGGTMSNTSVLAGQCLTAVIDGISGAVVDIVLWVRGNR